MGLKIYTIQTERDSDDFTQLSPGISVPWSLLVWAKIEEMGSVNTMTFFKRLKLPRRNVSRGAENHMALSFAALIPSFNRRF
jgi:hypothetical protein